MADHWDFFLKKLLRRNPQQFISWILKDAVVVDKLTTEIKRDTIYADVLFLVVLCREQMLLHIKFQSIVDKTMVERLLEHNVQISKEHGDLPVYSCVVCLRKAESVLQSPLVLSLPNGKEVLRFHYLNIELGEMLAESILSERFDDLLPLVFLTKNGKQANVIDEVVERLLAIQDKELLALTSILGHFIFQNDVDRETVRGRFVMLEDRMEESWKTYQYFVNKLLEGECKKGREEERQEWLQTQRNGLISAVQIRFPDLLADATERANRAEDPHVLQDIMLKVALAQNSEEAKKLLLELK